MKFHFISPLIQHLAFRGCNSTRFHRLSALARQKAPASARRGRYLLTRSRYSMLLAISTRIFNVVPQCHQRLPLQSHHIG